MSRYLIALGLILLMVECSSAFDFTEKIDLFATLNKKNEVEDEEKSLDILQEILTNISSSLDMIEELKDSGFPEDTVVDNTVIEMNDEGGTTGSTGTGTGIETETGTDTETDTGTQEAVMDDSSEEEGLKETVFSGQAQEFSNRNYIGYIKDVADDISGLCASRIHPDILYFVNDDGDSIIYAVDVSDELNIVSKITLDVQKGDWEDMACGPCVDETEEFCIYVSETGRVSYQQQYRIYKVREPEDIHQDHDYHIGWEETIDYDSQITDVQTLMVSPSGRIFIMGKTEDYFPLFEVERSGVYWEANRLFFVKIWSDDEGPLGGDISPDGTGWLFKMEDRVHYFYVADESNMKDIMTSSSNRQELPYFEERYCGSIAWSSTGGSYITISEGVNEPGYRYYRLR